MQKQRFEILQEKHPDSMVLQMQGNFYKAFNESAFVLSGLMDYKLRNTKSGYKCGFPVIAYDKVKDSCSGNRIAYVVYDGDSLVDQEMFADNQFHSFCNMYRKEILEDKVVTQNNVKSKQGLLLVDGCGMNMSDALSNLKDKVEKSIILNNMRVVSLNVMEDKSGGNLILLHGIVVFEG